jgi:predicted short-subunit dehydrogenase-like oxidoreductase (DUF2520 family)
MHVYVYGAGKVGTALAGAWKRAGYSVTLRAMRKGIPKLSKSVRELDVLVLAVRDRDLATAASEWAAIVPARAVALHCAGAQSADAIGALRGALRGVAQFHPMISFASVRRPPNLVGGHCHVAGDPAAERVANKLARAAKLVPRTFSNLDPVAYHCAAAFVANGSAALAALGTELLVAAGVPRETAPHMLGPLLASVAVNIGVLGFPDALTGPVRRGDVGAVARHDGIVAAKAPEARALYRQLCAAQLPLARALAEATPAQFTAIAEFLRT